MTPPDADDAEAEAVKLEAAAHIADDHGDYLSANMWRKRAQELRAKEKPSEL